MSEEDKLNKKVAEAVEVAANEAAKREIDELTEFEHAVDEMLASGYLDDTLRVIDTEGVGTGASGTGFRTDLASGRRRGGRRRACERVRSYQPGRCGAERVGVQAERRGVTAVRESGLPAPVRLWPRLRPRPKRPSDFNVRCGPRRAERLRVWCRRRVHAPRRTPSAP